MEKMVGNLASLPTSAEKKRPRLHLATDFHEKHLLEDMGNIRSRQRLEDMAPSLAMAKVVDEYNLDHDWHRLSKRLRKLLGAGTPERLQMDRLSVYSRNVLRNAAACDFSELLKVLLDAGLDIDAAVDDQKNTLLHVAVHNGQRGLVHMLLQRGANPRICNALALTPEEVANKSHYPFMSDIFVKYESARLQCERAQRDARAAAPPLLPLPTRR